MTIARACCPPTRHFAGGWQAAGGLFSTLLMGVHHFFWFIWEGVVVELPAGEYCTLLER